MYTKLSGFTNLYLDEFGIFSVSISHFFQRIFRYIAALHKSITLYKRSSGKMHKESEMSLDLVSCKLSQAKPGNSHIFRANTIHSG